MFIMLFITYVTNPRMSSHLCVPLYDKQTHDQAASQHGVNDLVHISTNIVQSKLYDLCDYCRDNEINLTRRKSQPFNQNNLCRSNPISSLSIEKDRSLQVCRMFKLNKTNIYHGLATDILPLMRQVY